MNVATEVVTLLPAGAVVAVAFARPVRARRPAVWCVVAAWVAAVVVASSLPPEGLVAATAGAVLTAMMALGTADGLDHARAVERSAAAAASARGDLLTTLLRLRSLEPGQVLDAVTVGAASLGFDDVRLVGADEATSAAVTAPVVVDGEVVTVVAVGHADDPVTAGQRAGVAMLADEAAVAVARARRYAADGASVEELRRLDGMTQDLVATVSHELRTPMTVVAGLGRTLERRWEDLGAARRTDLLQRIDGNADRLATMVRSLLDSSALERGELRVDAVEVPVATSFAAVAGRLGPLLAGHLVVDEVDPTVTVRADASLFEHVLENLLGNAARHTPPGTRVTVTARRHGGGDVEVVVADDGPGIAAADLPYVTDRFFRAGDARTRRGAGLGLGLALTRQILVAHGRDLDVDSVVDRGARFSFRLPAGAARSVPADEAAAAPSAPVRRSPPGRPPAGPASGPG